MRLAHHLLRHPSGVFHFRLVVPADLRQVFGKKILKISLRTKDPSAAKAYAYALGARYAQDFAEARGKGSMGSSFDDYLKGLRRFEIEPKADGGYAVRTDGSKQDNLAALKALDIVTRVRIPGLPERQSAVPHPAAPLAVAPEPEEHIPTLGEALTTYTQVEAPNLRPDTWQQRERACLGFVAYFGKGVKVHAVTRPMAARWANDLQRDGLTKRYVANQVSHVAQLFQAQIRSGFLPQGQNPVKGLVTLSAADKRQIRSSGRGWEPFELEALQKIFEPKNFARATQQHTRWGVLIGLYSGARVAEVAQIFLRDFVELDGTKCVYLTDDNDGASLKNDQSRRLVPLHPDLLALGLWDRVERLRAQGAERLFPDMKIDGKSGAGNAISKGFSYLLGRLEIKPRRAHGTLGFHSLRKNVIQQLQGTSLPAERRRALVGHEAGEDVHAKDYMRSWTAQELAVFFPGLPWGEWLKFDRLLPLLQS